jgi:hypothetical protein
MFSEAPRYEARQVILGERRGEMFIARVLVHGTTTYTTLIPLIAESCS